MSLSDREKFIMHMVTVMTLSCMGDKIDTKAIQQEIRNNRARKLTDKQISELWDDMGEEVLVGKTIYEEMVAKLFDGGKEFGV